MNMTETVYKAFMLAFLAACAFQDRKYGRISLILAGAGGLTALLCRIISGQTVFTDILVSFIPGVLLALIAFASSQAIGFGDAAMAAVAGLFLGCSGCVLLLLISLAICAAASAALVILRKKTWKDQMPFAPFMLAGYVLMEVISI